MCERSLRVRGTQGLKMLREKGLILVRDLRKTSLRGKSPQDSIGFIGTTEESV